MIAIGPLIYLRIMMILLMLLIFNLVMRNLKKLLDVDIDASGLMNVKRWRWFFSISDLINPSIDDVS